MIQLMLYTALIRTAGSSFDITLSNGQASDVTLFARYCKRERVTTLISTGSEVQIAVLAGGRTRTELLRTYRRSFRVDLSHLGPDGRVHLPFRTHRVPLRRERAGHLALSLEVKGPIRQAVVSLLNNEMLLKEDVLKDIEFVNRPWLSRGLVKTVRCEGFVSYRRMGRDGRVYFGFPE